MKTFVIACGGTGGHLSPGIAVAEELIKRGEKCILVVSKKAIDQKLCEAYPAIPFVQFPGVGFSKAIYKWPQFGFALLKNFVKSFHLLSSLKADAVIGFGGFSNVGVMLAAFLLRIPRFLHEANQKIGKANRFLSALSTCFYIPEGVIYQNVLAKRILPMGFPVRQGMVKVDKEEARKALKLPTQGKLISIVGGSQGAQRLTQWAVEHFEELTQMGFHILCLTGLGHRTQTLKHKNYAHGTMTFMHFSNQMNLIYSASDLVIGRAGAGTIAELTQCETPSILVPYPQAAAHHQLANALFFEQRGGCLVVEQKKLYSLFDEVIRLFSAHDLLEDMTYNLHQIKNVSTCKSLVDDIEKCLHEDESIE